MTHILTIGTLSVRTPYIVAMEFLPEGTAHMNEPMAAIYISRADETIQRFVTKATEEEFKKALNEWTESVL